MLMFVLMLLLSYLALCLCASENQPLETNLTWLSGKQLNNISTIYQQNHHAAVFYAKQAEHKVKFFVYDEITLKISISKVMFMFFFIS